MNENDEMEWNERIGMEMEKKGMINEMRENEF